MQTANAVATLIHTMYLLVFQLPLYQWYEHSGFISRGEQEVQFKNNEQRNRNGFGWLHFLVVLDNSNTKNHVKIMVVQEKDTKPNAVYSELKQWHSHKELEDKGGIYGA